MQHLIISLLITTIGIAFAQAPENLSGNPCTEQKTCGECIIADPECAWCSEEEFIVISNKRCDYKANLFGKCNVSHIVIPTHEIRKTKNEPLSNKGEKKGEYVQIKPQEIYLKLRPKSPYPLRVEFRQAEDYPVDLYYLMDLSKSMEDDKAKLAVLGTLLSERMANITTNFRLGFGSFVDKTVMPYVSTVPEKLDEPCTGCAAPYGFLNHMSLSLDTDNFTTEVNNAKVSGNLDAPEGGFDAIMQAIVCKNDIGWRPKSRKMLLFSTDSGFHYAGDGKLGGIVKPNDGECHLDAKGYYTQSKYLDYPSLSQLNHKIQENKMNVIFAVTANQVPVYERLSNQLEGASTGRLENDSSNVVELVKDQYDKITSGVEIRDSASSNIEVTYYSSCLGDKREKTNICKGLKVGTNVTFEAEIKVASCPKDRNDWNQTFQIYPVGLSEALIVHLEMICECDCEKPWNEEKASDKCSLGNGTYECGICNCYDNKYGRECECDPNKRDPAEDESACIFGNDTKVCSGRGVCHCGGCECFQRADPREEVSGLFCECLNFTCDRVDGKICNGPDHGICNCGVCDCKANWTGSACDCLKANDTCIAKDDDKICSGHGECICGGCKCHESDKESYSGTFCEDCHTCTSECDLYKHCIQCKVFGSGPLKEEECKSNCTDWITIIKDEKAEVKEESQKPCSFFDDDDCKVFFVYKIDANFDRAIVTVQTTKDCPEAINVLAIVLGVIGGIVAVGLALLLIWKLLTTIHDRREFAKFEKERQMAKWDTGENPIYKQATSTFKNPTYGGKQ